MKTTFFTLTCIVMCFFSSAQRVVYDKDGSKQSYTKDDVEIEFTSSGVTFDKKMGPESGALVSLIPTGIDILWKLTTQTLENRAKKFTAELTKEKSNFNMGDNSVPNIKFRRMVTINGADRMAFVVQLKAMKLPHAVPGFVYYVESIQLDHSAAKYKAKHGALDYTFEIKLTYYKNGEKKVHELSPLTLYSVAFGPTQFETSSTPADPRHRTDVLPLGAGNLIAGVSVKVIESNPAKVKAEKILALWNDQKDNVKTIINNFLPEQKKEGGAQDGDADAGSEDKKKATGGKPTQNASAASAQNQR